MIKAVKVIMKTRIKFLKIFFLLACLTACTTPRYVYPPGNVNELNTDKDEIAPIQKPLNKSPVTLCESEFSSPVQQKNDGIHPSAEYLKQLLSNESGLHVDEVTFVDSSSGFISVSHPPDEKLSVIKQLPLGGIIGGTDLFEFSEKKGKYVFHLLDEPINTKVWDSHPFAMENEKGDILLLWASDRADYKKGFGSPFQMEKGLTGNADTILGNSDLYYAFEVNGKWGTVHNFAELGGSINSPANEGTPFLYCLCYSPTLLFSSNRNNKDPNDYDLYDANLKINFNEQKIEMTGDATRLPKAKDTINSEAKEFFPFIPEPYSSSGDTVPYIYFSSDRYDAPVHLSDGEQMKSHGGFDIYKFKFNKSCRPPKINYRVVVLDAENKDRIVKEPFVILKDESGNKVIQRSDSNPATFSLEYQKQYTAFGGSNYDKVECQGTDSVISHYAWRKVTPIEPSIEEHKKEIEYLDTTNAKETVQYDTTLINEAYQFNDISKIKASPEMPILSIKTKADSLIVTRMKINKKIILESGSVKKLTKKLIEYDTIPLFDTTFVPTAKSPVRSELTKAGAIPHFEPVNDTLINDTVYIEPRYYHFPPCKWAFVKNLEDYRRNVPYFQTGFWEVNTSKNLENHLALLDKKDNTAYSFIELSPYNQYFGPRKSGLTQQERHYMQAKRWRRIADYEEFAKIVDENLNEMADAITDTIIPSFDKLQSKSSQNEDKLFIQVNAYSDIRPVIRGTYLGNKKIQYIAASLDDDMKNIRTNPVNIAPGASLRGQSNDTLSKLRAYFGYNILLKILKSDSLFNSYLERGLVLLPDSVPSQEEFNNKLAGSKIIFLVEGRRTDPEGTFSIPGYVRKQGDYYGLDEIRRINVVVNRLEYIDGNFNIDPCCSKSSSRKTDEIK